MTATARPDFATDDGLERVLVVTAHPDDVDFGTAGSVATWTAAGIDVTYCVVTDGEAGGDERSTPRSEVAKLRQTEQRAAADCVGVSDVRFLGYPDGRVEPGHGLRHDISRVIRQVRPQRVVTQSPDRVWDRIYASHPDHLATGEAAACAVYPDARNPFAHRELLDAEGLEPWSVAQLWLMGTDQPNAWVEITATFDDKIRALGAHESQMGDLEGIKRRIREWATVNAQAGGLAEGCLAEGFRTVDTR